MMRCALVVVLVAGCWATNAGKAADPGPSDRGQLELAASRQEIATLKRRLQEATGERDEAIGRVAALEARIRELEALAIATPGQAPAPPSPPPPPPRRREPDAAKTYAIALGNWPQRGPADAKVTMVFVHDHACPYCEKARATIDDLLKRYGKDLRVVYRPFVIRPRQSMASALALCAAGRQRKFDKLEPLLWEKGFQARNYDADVMAPDGTMQSCWAAPGSCPVVVGFATEAGLDVGRFKADLPACEPDVQDSMRELSALAVNATPSFFINGRYMSGAQPIDRFTVLIDEEKLKAEERIRRGTPRARYYQEWVIARGETTVGP
ncbi:MAG TPA: thioredoxin domain-containing protein [Kofleriaceae bacterium]|nr:thioredoxin domain-containing protein [Kofleriaceae bacterium]